MSAIEKSKTETSKATTPTTPTAAETSLLAAPGERGKTYVADDVVSTIARLAAEQIDGVHQIGVSGIKGVLQKLGSGGVQSEVGMKEAAVTLDVVIEYGFRIREVTDALRAAVVQSVEHMASRDVIAVDINVVDIYIAKPEAPTSRALL